MATFRAIHPYVREASFAHGFVPVSGDDYRVQHPKLHGKRAQIAFYKAFCKATQMPGVRLVSCPGKDSGRTLLFPQVPESRWEAARLGVSHQQYIASQEVDCHPDFNDSWEEPAPSSEPTKKDKTLTVNRDCKSMSFSGKTDDQGQIVALEIKTTNNQTARALLGASLWK